MDAILIRERGVAGIAHPWLVRLDGPQKAELHANEESRALGVPLHSDAQRLVWRAYGQP